MNDPTSLQNDGDPGQQPRPGTSQVNPELLNALRNVPIGDHHVATEVLTEQFRLNFFDVTCFIINRTIGTGIFTAPREVMRGVRSPGIAILVWFCGCIYGLSGAHVFVEYGLNVPRYVIDGVEQSVPRSGGELHYLQYVFPWPRYKKNTVLLFGVLYGISFICVGNMASNCINCALRLMEAADPHKPADEFSQGSVRGIAILIAVVTCFIHAFSRRGGILLNNALTIIKVFILLFIIVSTWVVAGGWSGIGGHRGLRNSWSSASVSSPPQNRGGYAQAFLSVIFSFYGFEQPCYVLGEIKHPRRTLPRAMWWGMGIVSVLYVAVNICYMIIVPAAVQLDNNVAQEFFDIVFDNNIHAKKTINAFLAVSSLGNIVVWAYTASRMKQEIAKQGFIPFAGFFAKDRDVSLGRFLMWLNRRTQDSSGRPKVRFFDPANHMEKTPVGALILHVLSCVVLILATYGMSTSDAYDFLIMLFSYVIAAWFGVCLAFGLLILHFRGPPPSEPVHTPKHNYAPDQPPVKTSWDQMIKGTVNPTVGIVCAILYLLGNLYPVVTSWIPPKQSYITKSVAWYLVPLTSWCVLAFSALWYLGFLALAAWKKHYHREEFVHQVVDLEFDWAEKSPQDWTSRVRVSTGDSDSVAPRGGLIIENETIYTGWRGMERDGLELRDIHHDGGTVTTGQQG